MRRTSETRYMYDDRPIDNSNLFREGTSGNANVYLTACTVRYPHGQIYPAVFTAASSGSSAVEAVLYCLPGRVRVDGVLSLATSSGFGGRHGNPSLARGCLHMLLRLMFNTSRPPLSYRWGGGCCEGYECLGGAGEECGVR